MQIVNIAAYKFVGISDLEPWRELLKERCDYLELKGTIVLAPEGINLFLAAESTAISAFLSFLRHDELFGQRFTDLDVKDSHSAKQPFRRMVVRIAKEIITMRHPMIRPAEHRAPAIDPQTLKLWLDRGHDDEGRKVVLLDTRNAFEVEIGTFEGAVDFGIERFSEFPEKIRRSANSDQSDFKDKTIVSFCTGGIRCEKAALFMRELDLPHVFQLDGGILRYFEQVGGAHWRGECFVFDDRVAVDPELRQTTQSYEGRTGCD